MIPPIGRLGNPHGLGFVFHGIAAFDR
jgi:hypothetical protein